MARFSDSHISQVSGNTDLKGIGEGAPTLVEDDASRRPLDEDGFYANEVLGFSCTLQRMVLPMKEPTMSGTPAWRSNTNHANGTPC